MKTEGDIRRQDRQRQYRDGYRQTRQTRSNRNGQSTQDRAMQNKFKEKDERSLSMSLNLFYTVPVHVQCAQTFDTVFCKSFKLIPK